MNENWKYDILEDNKLFVVKFFPLKKILTIAWNRNIRKIPVEEFKHILQTIKKYIELKLSTRIFHNLQDFGSESQNANKFIYLLEAFINSFPPFEKEAYLMPIFNLDCHMSIIKILHKRGNNKVFLNADDVMEWLMK